jgi:hypothetical protein
LLRDPQERASLLVIAKTYMKLADRIGASHERGTAYRFQGEARDCATSGTCRVSDNTEFRADARLVEIPQNMFELRNTWKLSSMDKCVVPSRPPVLLYIGIINAGEWQHPQLILCGRCSIDFVGFASRRRLAPLVLTDEGPDRRRRVKGFHKL